MDEPLNQRVEQTTHLDLDVRSSFAAVRGWAVAHPAELACAALLAAMALQMFAVISRKSITVDEIVMIPSAYYHLAAGNFQLVNEHPPLAKIIAGVPALFVQPNEVKPEQIVGEPGSFDEKWSYAERFWENNPGIFESLSFWPRVPAIMLTVLLGLLIFKFARELFGPLARSSPWRSSLSAHGLLQPRGTNGHSAALRFLLLSSPCTARRVPSFKQHGLEPRPGATAFSMLLAGPALAVFL